MLEAQSNYRTGRLWVSPMGTGMCGYRGIELGEPMVIATKKKGRFATQTWPDPPLAPGNSWVSRAAAPACARSAQDVVHFLESRVSRELEVPQNGKEMYPSSGGP